MTSDKKGFSGRTEEQIAEGSGSPTMEWLAPGDIVWPEGRITSRYGREGLAELARSMTQTQDEPLGIRRLGDGTLEGQSGYNRCQAARLLKWDSIFCVVRPGEHIDVVRGNLRTGLMQSTASALDQVEGIAHAHFTEEIGVDIICQDIGRPEDWVLNRLAVFAASPVVKQALGDELLGIGHAILLAGVETEAEQIRLCQLTLARHWTIEELKKAIDTERGESQQTERVERAPKMCFKCSSVEGRNLRSLSVCGTCLDTWRGAPDAEPLVALLRRAEQALAEFGDTAALALEIGEALDA